MRPSRRLFAFATLALLATPAYAQHGGAAPPDRQQRLTSAESFIPMPTLSSVVLQRESPRGTLVVDLGIDVPDAALRARASANAPRIRDALRTALALYASTYYRPHTAPDPGQLARLLQTSVDRTLGAPGARVLLTNILYQNRQS